MWVMELVFVESALVWQMAVDVDGRGSSRDGATHVLIELNTLFLLNAGIVNCQIGRGNFPR
jgi:hypothetical protein